MIKIEMKNLPFRGGKENIAPDHPKCIACGKCCTSFEGVPLLPEDFINEDLESELRVLMQMGLLYIQVRFSSYDVILHMPNRECPFLTDKGCALPADKRPAGCRYYAPATGEKGFKRSNARFGCISKLRYKSDIWTWRKDGREGIITRLLKDLDDEHKGICW